MSHSEEADKGDNCRFKWGKKRGIGGKNQDAQFYESFTYDGTEYFLYDCVYVYKEGEPEPHIGKLVKIWEQKIQKKKKIKILWFFRPIELLNLLGDDDEPLKNEIILASGEGVGLYNMNPLEVINGKCNVICTSKDERNRQPSEEELKAAEFIFYRSFDVGNYTISDKLGENIAGIEVKYIFNREDGKESSSTSKPEANRKEENGIMVCTPKDDKVDHITSSVVKADASLQALAIPDGVNSEDSNPKSRQLLSSEGARPNEKITKPKQEPVLDEKKPADKPGFDSDKDAVKAGNTLISDSDNKEKLKYVNASDPENRPSKKARLDSDKVSSPSAFVKDFKTENSVKRPRIDPDNDGGKASDTLVGVSDNKSKRKPISDSVGQDNRPTKKAKPDEKAALPFEETKHKGSSGSGSALEKDNKTKGLIFEVVKRPDTDRSKWFKGLPWEERMEKAREQGTLLLLENFDPSYTSSEIEDVIWSGFKESCTAKVVPRTAFSSPHCGQAFVIFKSQEAADMAIRKLDGGCLMLPNGRPLVGSKGSRSVLGVPIKFVGHLSIDKIKFHMQRDEMKKAVSTSHCSQPNTIEYDMAMEWGLLQEKSDRWWKELFKQQGEELEKLKRSLKTK